MNKLWILLKTNFINSFGINKLFKNKKGETLPLIFIILIGLIGIIIFFLFGLYMYFYGEMFAKAGKTDGVLLIGITFGSLIITISSVSRTNSYLFASKDFDILMSLPISEKTIFMSKVINLLIVNYVMFSYFYIPSIIVYAIFNSVNFLYWLFAIIGFFVIPLPIISIFGFVSCQLGKIRLSQKTKKILATVLYLFLTIAIVFFAMIINGNVEDETVFFENMYNSLKRAYYLGYLMVLGIKGLVINFLGLCALGLILFVLFFLYSSKNYLKVNSNQKYFGNKKLVKDESDKKQTHQDSVIKALIKKEIKGYFGIPMYVVNTIVGPVLSVIFIYFLISQSNVDYLKIGEKYIEMRLVLPPMIIAIMLFSVSLTSTTASTISIEGKSIWILKTLPIKEGDLFKAKIIINLLITIPFIIVNNILVHIMIQFEMGTLETISMLLIPIIMTSIVSKLGLYINICFPKFDYSHPAQVVKQSLSVLVTMLFSNLLVLLLIGITAFTYFLCHKFEIAYMMAIIFTIVVYFLISIVLMVKGTKKYKKINC